MRLRTQLTLALLGASLGTAGVLGANYLRLNRRALAEDQRRQVRRTLEEVRRVRDEAVFGQDPLMLVDALKSMLATHPEVQFFEVLHRGMTTRLTPLAPREGAAEPHAVEAGGGELGRIQVGFSTAFFEEQRREAAASAWANMRASALAVMPAGALLALLLGGWLSRRVQALSETVDRIGEGRLGAVAEIGGSDELARLAERINQMSRRLGELEAAKKLFVASVTHELRSPLAAIESCVRLLRSEPGPRAPVEADMLRRIEANAARLGHFVTNLLELAKIERGKLELHPRATDVRALFEDAVLFFEPRAREAGLELRLAREPGLPSARLDPDLLTQVLANLVSNAIKFTPKGGSISVEARAARLRGRDWLEGSVRDNGPGIAPEALSRLFAAFERAPDASRAEGTGLGLAISKAIVELHGGEIGAESAPGQGSRFWFRVPA